MQIIHLKLAQLRKWWEIILNHDPHDLQENSLTLIQLSTLCSRPAIASLQLFTPPLKTESSFLEKKPAFKLLNFRDIYLLRHWLQNEMHPQLTSNWAEVILRFFEINLSDIDKKLLMQYGSRLLGEVAFLELTAFLLDYFSYSKDLRYMNMVLKILDQKSLFSPWKITRNLRLNGMHFKSALLKVYLLVKTDLFLMNLDNGFQDQQ